MIFVSNLVIDFDSIDLDKNKSLKDKIELAKIAGNKEVEILKKAVNTLSSSTEDIVLGKAFINEVVILFNAYMEKFLEPVLKGKKPAYADENSFNELRKEQFMLLINKYAD